MATAQTRKKLGAYYTPHDVAQCLVRWVVRDASDRLLDPSCGDGRFIAAHGNSVGVDCDVDGVIAARKQVSCGRIHVADFFDWVQQTPERFECVAGNPPFIRYQHFTGPQRNAARHICRRLGADFSGLASSWAPFLVAAASLLKPGGRLAFLVPAELGHAPYAKPLLSFLVRQFEIVHVIAIREKLFPELSEDVWVVYAEGYGRRGNEIRLTACDRFQPATAPPAKWHAISMPEFEAAHCRLRTFLLPLKARQLYESLRASGSTVELGSIAQVGIGYVTGANEFFHLRPTTARFLRIPHRFLVPTVRNGRILPDCAVTDDEVRKWRHADEPFLLLRIPRDAEVPPPVSAYLDSPAGIAARAAYKCRTRKPWYVVPDVKVPDAFLSYMCGKTPQLAENSAGCTCTNSVHAIRLTNGLSAGALARNWKHPLVELSCELEGHPLGGGLLKLEPREAARVLVPKGTVPLSPRDRETLTNGIDAMRQWRHYA